MESVKDAAKRFLKNAANACRKSLRRWALKTLRNLIDRADEWLHEKEVGMRQEARKQEFLAEVDPVASEAREKAIKRVRKPRALHPEPRRPRLVYQHGEFVRQ